MARIMQHKMALLTNVNTLTLTLILLSVFVVYFLEVLYSTEKITKPLDLVKVKDN